MNIQYNLENLKKSLNEVLNCLEKEDGSVANFESLIKAIKTFQEIHTDIAKMLSIPALNSIVEFYSGDIFEANCKLNFFNLMSKISDHCPYISDQELD